MAFPTRVYFFQVKRYFLKLLRSTNKNIFFTVNITKNQFIAYSNNNMLVIIYFMHFYKTIICRNKFLSFIFKSSCVPTSFVVAMFGNISTLIFHICIYYFQFIHCNLDSLRIFQGRDAVPGEFPYAVALAVKISKGTQSELYQSLCTGSIVTPVWTLTAGHCVELIRSVSIMKNKSTGEFKMVIRYAIHSEKKHHEWGASDIINTVLHPGYKHIASKNTPITIINDVGLLKTSETIVSVLGTFSSVDYRTLYGHKVSTFGFGLTKSEEGVSDAISLNKTLQVYEAIIVKCSLTFQNYRLVNTLRPFFCLSWECNKPARSCSGDSGGPVIHPTGIIGVMTAANVQACDTMKNVFTAGLSTPLSPYLSWIVAQVRNT